MAAGFARQLAGDRAEIVSGGSDPADELNPAVVGAMAEVGVDLSGEVPRRWTEEILRSADVIVTMGCAETCPVIPGKRYAGTCRTPQGSSYPTFAPSATRSASGYERC
jgi:protein-tyrosine-phosphatase